MGLHGCRMRGRPPWVGPTGAALGLLTPQGPPAPTASWRQKLAPCKFPARGEPQGTSHAVFPSQGVLAVWDLPSSVTTGGRGRRVADPARPLATFRVDRLIVAFLRQACPARERAVPQLGCLE